MKEITIEELFNVKGGKRLPKGNLLQSIPNNHPYIRITDIKLNRILELDENFLYVPTNIQGIIKNYVVNEGDIVISIVGQIGLITRIGKSLNLANLTENCVKLIPKQRNIIDLNYILYYLKSNLGQDQILERVVGSTQPKLPIYNINSIVIKLPHIQKQQAIAGVLSALDDKIDLLQRQNQTLEQMAATLFRQWFIEEAREDWEQVTLADICIKITDGAHHSPETMESGYAMASVKDMHNWGINRETCRKISESDYISLVDADCKAVKGDILIAKDGSYLKHVFLLETDLDVVLLSSIDMLRPNGLYHPMLLTIFLKLESTYEEMINIVTGAVIPRIVLKDFRKFPITLPPIEIQEKAVKIIQPIFEKCWNNNNQIQTLQSLRDTLLPKLISGEVRLKGFSEKVEGLQDAS